jgi:hypothetical protein
MLSLKPLLLLNNIVAPCIAIALISPECFFYVYNAASPVTTTYTVPGCEISALGLTCNGSPLTMTTTYTLPFTYSYQCSSALLSSFADVFVYRYLFGSIVATSAKILLKVLQSHFFHYDHENKESRTLWRSLYIWFYYCSTVIQPTFARPLHRFTDTTQSLFVPVEEADKNDEQPHCGNTPVLRLKDATVSKEK